MTPDDYLQRSAAVHKRLEILRQQIDALAVIGVPGIRTTAVKQLMNRQHAIIAEIEALDEEFWCA